MLLGGHYSEGESCRVDLAEDGQGLTITIAPDRQ